MIFNSCKKDIQGCKDPIACNYGSATVSNNMNTIIEDDCEYAALGYDCDGMLVEYVIGMEIAGGFLFFVDSKGENGLLAAKEDIGTFEWGCEDIVIETDSLIGSGYQNTHAIINHPCQTVDGGITAAQAAFDYEYTEYTEHYSGWYLPSIDELLEMQKAIGHQFDYDSTDGTHHETSNIGLFRVAYYWSSSSHKYNGTTTSLNATAARFDIDYTATGGLKRYKWWVRPIRSIELGPSPKYH